MRTATRADLPSGTVTFLFTDVEGSTKLLESLGAEAYAEALAEHRATIRAACAEGGGVEVDTQGDAFFFAFTTAPGALAAAAAFTEALRAGSISVRVGVHTGTPLLAGEGYVGADVHRAARIAAAGHGGQIVVSSATAALVGDKLRDLGEHRFKDLSAPERVYQLGDGDFPPLKTLYKTNLPVPATPFLGRARELAEVVELLTEGGARLVTLTGPGGTGKTRLALQAAAEAADAFPDGVYWTALAPLRDPDLVLPSIAHALSVREEPGVSVADALLRALDGDRVLLVLDNLEHLLPAAADVAALLVRTTCLKVLVTSRETLRLRAEREYAVPTLASDEAVALFCDRAQTEPSATIGEICRRLDHLPLAIELAAARLKLLSPEQLLERLSTRLDLLRGGRDSDPRQQTLRATIEWSYDLLSPEERALFARLSVFVGGCTLEAAEGVCDAKLETLESLLDKSLLRRRDTELGPRFWMLASIREFAAEQLDEDGGTELFRGRHAEHVLALAEELEPAPLVIQSSGVGRLLAETDNVRAAIEHFATDRDPTREARLVGSLFRFWETAGLISEGRRAAEHALSRTAEDPVAPMLRAKVLYAASLCLYWQGELELANRLDEDRLDLAREAGDRVLTAVALNDLGLNAAELGDIGRAMQLLDQSRVLAADLGQDEMLWLVTHNLAEAQLMSGNAARARELMESQLETVRLHGSPGVRALTALALGQVLVSSGDVRDGLTVVREALESGDIVGPQHKCACLDVAAALCEALGDPTRGARVLGASHALRADGGVVRVASEQLIAEPTERALRDRLGDAVCEREFAVGAGMTLDEAVAYALEFLPDA